MNDTNGFHSSSSSISSNGIDDTTKYVQASADSNIISINKGFKSKHAITTAVNDTSSMKGYNRKQNSVDATKKRPIHSDLSSINNDSTKKIKLYSHANTEYIPSTSSNNPETHKQNYCYSCGECYGELVSCTTCPAIFHLLCINPSLSKDDMPKNSYFCENCQTVKKTKDDLIHHNKQQKLILPFSFTPKISSHINNPKKIQRYKSTLEHTELPTVLNDQTLVQSSDEIHISTTGNDNAKSKQLLLSTNLKRKRLDSSTSSSSLINISPSNCEQIPNTQLNTLYNLFLSSQPEEFHGPSLTLSGSQSNNDKPNEKNSLKSQKYCFICRKSSLKQGPSIHCDYCPLTYHLDCLTPSMTSLPSPNQKWMCPNHIEPILDHYLYKDKIQFASERIKMYHTYSSTEQNVIIQDFTNEKQSNNHLLSNKINSHRLERVDISEIPKHIKEIYSQVNTKQNYKFEIEVNDSTEDENEQINIQSKRNLNSYDPCIWDTLQAIMNHIVNIDDYEFSSADDSSIDNHCQTNIMPANECNDFNTFDTLLQMLNEPDSIVDQSKLNETNDFSASMATKFNNDSTAPQPISKPLTNSLSLLMNLSQFRLSHAALIHLQSRKVIYISKHVIWFGSLSVNDICLNNFSHSQLCQYISDRHACLYYDRKRNLFELLNYSEYGTIVNEFHYGIGNSNDIDHNKQENDNIQRCSCLTKSMAHPTWDGPAEIEQGTVIRIGCHEFLFYRHIVR